MHPQFVLITRSGHRNSYVRRSQKIAVCTRWRCSESMPPSNTANGCEKKFSPQLEFKLKNLEHDAKALLDKLVSNGNKMSGRPRRPTGLQKARDFSSSQGISRRSEAAATTRDMLKK